jgi:hypothetical protein
MQLLLTMIEVKVEIGDCSSTVKVTVLGNIFNDSRRQNRLAASWDSM